MNPWHDESAAKQNTKRFAIARKQYSTKRLEFQQLTSEERAQIEILLRQRISKAQARDAITSGSAEALFRRTCTYGYI